MTAASTARAPREDGFSLLEAVIAAGLLLLTVVTVTAAVTNVSRAGSRADAAMRVEGALQSVVARLSSLPFCAPALPAAPVGGSAAATDLVAAVFPDAGAPRDTAEARYSATDADGVVAGSFVTRFDQDGVPVTCVARFRDWDEGTWLGPADLAGWDLAVSVNLPAPVLVVDVAVEGGGVVRTARLVREAGADPVPSPQPTVIVEP